MPVSVRDASLYDVNIVLNYIESVNSGVLFTHPLYCDFKYWIQIEKKFVSIVFCAGGEECWIQSRSAITLHWIKVGVI